VPKRRTLFVLGVTLPGGFASAGEDTGQLTLLQAISRLRQGIPVYSCALRRDWFSGISGQCPDGATLEWIEDIQNGKAVFERGNRAGPKTKWITMEERL
jgi:hypothetical protein